jgi:hypothetical protein
VQLRELCPPVAFSLYRRKGVDSSARRARVPGTRRAASGRSAWAGAPVWWRLRALDLDSRSETLRTASSVLPDGTGRNSALRAKVTHTDGLWLEIPEAAAERR